MSIYSGRSGAAAMSTFTRLLAHRRSRRAYFALMAAGLAVLAAAATCGRADPTADPTATPVAEAPTATAPTVAAAPASPAAVSTPTAAASPVDSPTPTEQATSTPAPWPFPTPSSASDDMWIGGSAWVDARPAVGEVLAFVNGNQCGKAQAGRIQSDPPSPVSSFAVRIASDATQAGCGEPGAVVTITINGRPFNNPIVWQPGYQNPVAFDAGPPYARYYGDVKVPPGTFLDLTVNAYIGDTACGAELSGDYFGPTAWSYFVVVDPDALRSGCGRDGTDVAFRLEVNGQSGILIDVLPWIPGVATQLRTVDLTTSPPATPAATAAIGQ